MNFSDEQIRAVSFGDGPALVLAGPGSGKTAVITERTLRLVRDKKVKPGRVLVITFTKAAAEEMKQRYLAKAKPCEYGVCFGTFHAVFFRILRESRGAGKNSILKPEDRFALAERCYLRIRNGRHFSSDDIKALLSALGRRKTGKTDVYSGLPCTAEEFDAFCMDYTEALEERGLMDFDDILNECFSLLSRDKRVLEFWQGRFDYILVDEYQDINRVQYETTKLLAAPKNNLFAVGDDDQSIYAFRGADPSLTKRFMEDYPGAQVLILNRNFRSAACITKCTQALISHNRDRIKKKTKNDGEKKGRLELCSFEDRHEEYETLADLLKECKSGSKAVLYRTNGEPRALLKTLRDKNIEYDIRDEGAELYSHFITRDMLAYARLADGSLKREDFLRVCNRPERYIKRTIFEDETVNLARVREKCSFLGVKIEPFLELLEAIRGLDPFGVIMYVRQAAGYTEFIENLENAGDTDLSEILEEVQESARGSKCAADWERSLKHREGGKEAAPDAVKLMTFHASKGLEFDSVYIIDLNEGVSPHKSAGDDGIEEERRAAYVAMTRARTGLTLMYVKKRGGRYIPPSRFIKETGL